MKIAIIHPDFRTKGGAENIVLWLCEELSQNQDFETTIFSVDFSDWEKRIKDLGIAVKKIPVPESLQKSKLLTLIFASIFLKNELKKFDIVNPQNYPASLWAGIANILSRKTLPKIVWFCFEPARFLYRKICNSHTPENLQVQFFELDKNLNIRPASRLKILLKNTYKPLLRYFDKKSVKTFSGILTLSNTISQQIKQIYGIDSVQTCYMGIKNIKKESSHWKTTNGDEYLLTVCRLEAIKNLQKVIEAFSLLKKENKLNDIKYYIVGNGPFEEKLKTLIIHYNLVNEVILCGYKKPEELLSGAYYLDCLAYIYLPFDEPFGLPYLEAAAFSKPSIASNHGGPSELVVDGQTGLLVDPLDLNEIADKIGFICNNNVERRKMGENAHKRLIKHFRWDQFVDRYTNAIKDIGDKK